MNVHLLGFARDLAWTSMGGATLYIEAIKVAAEKTEMKLTGQAGQVMKESSEIAWSYLHSAINKYARDIAFLKNRKCIFIFRKERLQKMDLPLELPW